MQAATQPRHFTPGATLTEAGLPGDRHARIAARRAFVALKLTFLHALQDAPGDEWLRHQIRSAEEPVDLWLLRAPVFAALAGQDSERRSRRQMLRRGLDSVFPDLEPASAFASF
jgi:hypothetical protein